MIAELVLLGIGTVGAIGYDQHLDKQELAGGQVPTPGEDLP